MADWLPFRRHCYRHLYISDNRSFPPHRGQSRILLGNALLVDFPDFRNSRYHRLNLNQRHTHFFTDRRFLFFVILDYKRNFWATGTRIERLVSNESQTKTRIRRKINSYFPGISYYIWNTRKIPLFLQRQFYHHREKDSHNTINGYSICHIFRIFVSDI